MFRYPHGAPKFRIVRRNSEDGETSQASCPGSRRCAPFAAYSTFAAFIVAMVLSVSHPGGLWDASNEGFEVIATGMQDAATLASHAIRKLRRLMSFPMHLPLWTAGVTVVLALVVFFRSGRPLYKGLAMLGMVALLIWQPLWRGVNALSGTANTGTWLGLSVALLALGQFARWSERGRAHRRWHQRRAKATGELEPTEHLPAPLAALVDETRSVRASLDISRGLCVDTRRILWDWDHLVRECPADEAGILAELGLSTDAVKEASAPDRAQLDDARQLIAVDNALAHFEQTLVRCHSYGYR